MRFWLFECCSKSSHTEHQVWLLRFPSPCYDTTFSEKSPPSKKHPLSFYHLDAPSGGYPVLESNSFAVHEKTLKSRKRLFASIERLVSGESLLINAGQSSHPLTIELDENDVLIRNPTAALRAIDSLLIAAEGYRL